MSPPDDERILADFATAVGPVGPVAVSGRRTRWAIGGALDCGARVIAAPTGIVEHNAAEMIVTVRAGTTVTELHDALAPYGQRTALPDRGGTVGGALAVGEDDLEVAALGRVRASLLQVRYVSAEGRMVVGGGRTVKNVSGYDLPRLMVGSLGTLGLMAEVTLLTKPRPPCRIWVAADGIDPFAVATGWRPHSAVLWDGTTTWVCVGGHGVDVAAERRRLASLGDFEEVGGPPDMPQHRWSIRPSETRGLPERGLERFVANVTTGTVLASTRSCARPKPPGLADLEQRVKANFDPTGRLNPGRRPGSAA